jgi:hypothetical protein
MDKKDKDKRMHHYDFYAKTKTCNSVARIYLEIHSILEFHSTQYCSLLAEV